MRKMCGAVLFALITFISVGGVAQDQQASARRILRQTPPVYPDLARRIHLEGTVKVLATVEASGDVRSVEAVGGSPLLIKAAEDAVTRWKFAPGAESREVVELHFTP